MRNKVGSGDCIRNQSATRGSVRVGWEGKGVGREGERGREEGEKKGGGEGKDREGRQQEERGRRGKRGGGEGREGRGRRSRGGKSGQDKGGGSRGRSEWREER